MTTDAAVHTAPQLDRAEAVARLRPRARVYDIREVGRFGGTCRGNRPTRITMLRPNPDNANSDQLLVDHHLIPRRYWTWDAGARKLWWSYGSGDYRMAGHIEFIPGEFTGYGSVITGGSTSSVEVRLAPASYTCRVAAVPGAYLDTQNHSLVWPASDDPSWTGAKWIDDAVRFQYQITSDIFIGKVNYHVLVGLHDLQTGVGWNPPEGKFGALVDANLRFTFTSSDATRPADDRSRLAPPANGIRNVLPLEMSFQFDGVGEEFNGAMLVDSQPTSNLVYAVHGVTDSPATIGTYRLRRADGEWTAVALGVDALIVDDRPAAKLTRRGTTVSWHGLSREAARATGLPTSGTLRLSADGSRVLDGSRVRTGHRTTYESLSRHRSVARQQPLLHRRATVMAERQATGPNPTDLKNMTQFVRTRDGWIDKAQQEALKDFYAIMLNRMDGDLRHTYLSDNKPVLDPALEHIANTTGTDGADPAAWYRTLSVAYLTNALSNTSDPYAQKLNALRAQSWLKDEVARSTVYQAQAPLMYARQFAVINPGIHDFLIDQQENADEYNAAMAVDSAAWLADLERVLADAPTQLTAMRTVVRTLTDTATKNGTFWAYYYFRYCSQPAALALLELISLSGASLDGSEYSRRIQTNCVVLEQLDPSKTFLQQYLQVIQLFQLSNVLPKLIDYAGNVDAFTYSSTEIVKAFIARYSNTTDPQFQQVVDDFEQALADDTVREVLDAFGNFSSAIVGMYSWEQIALKFEKEWPKASKIPLRIAQGITLAFVCAGMYSFVYGAMHWDQLHPDEKLQLVEGGTDVLVQLTSAVVKRGVAYAAILETESISWSNFAGMIKGDIMHEAEQGMSKGIGRWLIGSGKAELPEDEDFAYMLMDDSDGVEESLVTKLLGRNLDEFVATRLGAMFAIVNIVLSAWALAHGGSDLELAANALFLVSACLELVATAGSWALGAAGITELGGFAVASIASVVGGLAAFAAIVGTIILLVMIFGTKPKSPVEQFAEGPAANAGYYLVYDTAIEYLQVSEPEPGQPQMVGVSVRSQDGGYLTMHADGTLTIGELDHTAATCFYLSADSSGRARLTATLRATSTDRLLTAYSLTLKDGKATAARTDPDGKGQWILDRIPFSPEAQVGDRPTVVPFQLAEDDGEFILFLSRAGTDVILSAFPHTWYLSMEATRPTDLVMPDITVYTYQNDGQFWPVLGQPGSAPRTFTLTTLTEPLPPFLTFNPANGLISWAKPGTLPPSAMKRTEYELSVSNAVGATGPVRFAIEVRSGALPPVTG